MFDVIDFNNNQELDWKEWHNFISTQVHAGKDVLGGSEMVLPSGTGLSLDPGP